jgi:Vitamin K-dependent gamma-carboxylase
MKLTDRFDSWVQRGPFTSADLGIYRIIYALAALLTVPDISWISQYPDSIFNPPPGPIALFTGFPSLTVLVTLEVLRSGTLLMLGLGIWTKYVSIAAWLMLSVTYGLTFCFGKVDHTILMVAVPLVMAFSGWGNRFSIDATRRQGEPPPQQQWPLRLLALLIAWAFFAAALTKILTGWLSFSSQAARGYFVLGFHNEDNTYLLARWVAAHDVRPVWEIVDWMTVIFEVSLLVALPWWRAFRTALAVATTFHVGVLLVMNIEFTHAVVAYAAFVSWGSVGRRLGACGLFGSVARLFDPGRTPLTVPTAYVLLGLSALLVGGGSWFLMVNPVGKLPTGSILGNSLIVVAGLAGSTYLVLELRNAVRKAVRGRRAIGA